MLPCKICGERTAIWRIIATPNDAALTTDLLKIREYVFFACDKDLAQAEEKMRADMGPLAIIRSEAIVYIA